MSVTRDELYQQVWAEPMTTVARRYEVSSSFLARICSRLNVPRPPRGYWARIKVGQRVERPELPEARLGDEFEWFKVGDPFLSQSRPRRQIERPRQSKKRRIGERPTRHALLTAVREYFDAARVGRGEYLKPYKRLLVDIFVSKATLTRALDLANDLFLILEDHGHQVAIGPRDRYFSRPELDQREQGGRQNYGLDVWRPERPTVVFIGSLAFGLTLYEMTENVEVQLSNGKWVRVNELPPPKRRGYSRPEYTSRDDLPSGRLALRAWCASGWVEWEQHWRESKAGELASKFHTICRTLEEAVPALELATEEAKRKAEEERQRREMRRREEERQAAERRKAEAIKESGAELLEIVDGWVLARHLETFFTEAELRVQTSDDETRASVTKRLARARSLLGGTDALAHFSRWQAPEDRCADFERPESDGQQNIESQCPE